MNTKLYVGMKVGKLTIVGKNEEKTKKMNRLCWDCSCECGGTKIINSKFVSDNRAFEISCGCVLKSTPLNECKPGDRFGKLTLIKYWDGEWLCRCDCGNEITKQSGPLKTGNTKSCGCLWAEQADLQRKHEPRISSALNIWRDVYLSKDLKLGFESKKNISFDDFLKLTQQNCAYCNIEPGNKCNIFSYKNSLPRSLKEGDFIYNGLDRVDNDKNHTIENCVSCCILCNRAKRDRTLDDFKNWIPNLRIIEKTYKINHIELAEFYKTSVRKVWTSDYNDGDLSRDDFYCLSQYDCHYCGAAPDNHFNYISGDKYRNNDNEGLAEFIYNGLDRVDSNLKHDKNNVVPCCYDCNWTKSNYSLQTFHDWIIRIQKHLNNWKI